ncbi:LysR family transcriptional regulator [Rouxiella sp. Mn2063]|uniref:LysR family transcriptional regulator n=1 Tax=Rouxiella sp. Mn2063 TaxID=3395262 RepID=UPI003BE8D8B1
MHKVDFNNIDLNLLKLFDALVKERSVTRAGQQLGLSQPAASRALGRLRNLLNDKLWVRTAQGLELTPRAAALVGPVAKLLEDARSIVAPTQFDPAQATGRFSIAAIDHITLLLMPSLIARLTTLAPGMDLEIPPSLGDNVELVAQGNVDIAIGVYEQLPARFHQRALFDEGLVCVVRRGHPVIAAGMTLERFAELSHILVIITGHGESIVDMALAQHGLSRRVAVRLPHFLAAPALVAESDMVLSIPRRLAQHLALSMPIEVLELPLETGIYTPSMIWHERRHEEPSHMWLRKQLVEICAAF